MFNEGTTIQEIVFATPDWLIKMTQEQTPYGKTDFPALLVL